LRTEIDVKPRRNFTLPGDLVFESIVFIPVAAIDLGAPAREANGLGRACVQDAPRLQAQAPSGGPLALTRESIAECLPRPARGD